MPGENAFFPAINFQHPIPNIKWPLRLHSAKISIASPPQIAVISAPRLTHQRLAEIGNSKNKPPLTIIGLSQATLP
jgi:hypothetical protein